MLARLIGRVAFNVAWKYATGSRDTTSSGTDHVEYAVEQTKQVIKQVGQTVREVKRRLLGETAEIDPRIVEARVIKSDPPCAM
jgi:hypothetical protein